jgi:hypothetical protein
MESRRNDVYSKRDESKICSLENLHGSNLNAELREDMIIEED